MAFKHSKASVVKIDNSGGAAQDLSAYFNKFSFPREVDTAETTTFGKSSKTRVAGLKDAKITGEGPWDAVIEAHMQGILGFETVTVDYYPEGSTTGMRRMQVEAILVNYEPSSDIGDAVGFKCEFEATGDATIGTAP